MRYPLRHGGKSDHRNLHRGDVFEETDAHGVGCSHRIRRNGRSVVRHHTKDKGDLGVAKAHADLVTKGFYVLFPTTERAPFDLVAYADGTFHRVQVKYRSGRGGAIHLNLRSTWSDRHGVHSTSIDKAAVDAICIYCPETDECYYIRPTDQALPSIFGSRRPGTVSRNESCRPHHSVTCRTDSRILQTTSAPRREAAMNSDAAAG